MKEVSTADEKVPMGTCLVLLTSIGRYNCRTDKTYTRAEILIGLREGGAFARLPLREGQSSSPLTYIKSSAILAVEFPD